MAREGLIRGLLLRLRPNDGSSNYIEHKVAPGLAANGSYTWPVPPGTTQLMQADSTGQISFTSGGGGGSVTSVGLGLPASVFAVAGSPVTISGTISGSFVSQAANTGFFAPNGAAGVPNFRAMVAADVPQTLTSAWITDFDTRVRTSRLDQMALPTAAVNLNSQRITGLLDPSAAQDAATKNYVDATVQGLDIHPSVRAATTANLTIASPGATIDGVTMAANDRVLLKNQTTTSENGLWIWNGAAVPLTRAADGANGTVLTAGAFVFVEQGTVNADTGWVLTTDNPITIGTTGLTFTQFSGAGSFVDGNGLVRTGNQLDVVGTAGRISVGANNVDIDSTYVGQATITTLGTITTGTWNGTAIAVARGGTGAATDAAARTNLRAAGVFRGTFTSSAGAVTVGTGSVAVASNVVTITHDLGQQLLRYSVMDPAGKAIEPDDITYTSTTVTALDFSFMTIGAGTYAFLLEG